MVGGSIIHDRLKTFKDSLPPLESIGKFISEKKKEKISHVSGMVASAWKKPKESSLPQKIEAFSEERDITSVPSVKNDRLKTFKDSLPPLESIGKFISEKKKNTISHVSGLVASAWKKPKESSVPQKIEAFREERDNTSVPYVKNDRLKTFKDSLPPLDSIGKFISEKKKNTISHVSGLVASSWKKPKESSLPQKIEAFREERDNTSVPSVNKVMFAREIPESSLPRKIEVVGEERDNTSVPSAKKITSACEIPKSSLPRKIEVVRGNTSVPYVKNDPDYLVEIIKQHPYLFGIIVLYVLWKYYRYLTSSAGGGGGRRTMMKAHGRDCKIRENDIDRNPEPYCLDMRRKKGKSID